MLRMSAEEYRRLSSQSGLPSVKKNVPGGKAAKYHNKKVYVYSDGFAATEKAAEHGPLVERFDSVKEYHRAGELRLLERAGRIKGLKLQVPLTIQEKSVSRNGEKHRAIVYKADFLYIENGATIVEDVKGFDKKRQRYLTTETFRLKWKLLQEKYPEYTFRLF